MTLTLLHSERPKLYTILAFLSAIGLKSESECNRVKIVYNFGLSECNRVKVPNQTVLIKIKKFPRNTQIKACTLRHLTGHCLKYCQTV